MTAATTRKVAHTLDPGELAWIAAVPCAAVIVAAILLLGPPLGHAFMEPAPGEVLWPRSVSYIFGEPEPVKHARFLIALCGPLLLAAVVLASMRRPVRLGAQAARALVLASQLLLVAFVVVSARGQTELTIGNTTRWPVFTLPAWLAAIALALILIALMRRRGIAAWIARAAADTRGRRIAGMAVAAAVTACWLLTAVNTEESIGRAAFYDLPPWTTADTLAILDGRTPLVNFYAFYSQLWGYLAQIPLWLFGSTITVFSIVMTSLSGLSLLAVYSVLRRVARSWLLALALYLPLLAIGFLAIPYLPNHPANSAQQFGVWPMRYAGPYLLLWLTARHVDGARPRHPAWLFLAAGLVAINNLEFGIGALAGTVAALLAARPPRSWRAAARLAGAAAIGLVGAVALVTFVTAIHSGQLPHFEFLTEYARVYATVGFTAVPAPKAGLHLVLYATFAGAIAAAAVRVVRSDGDRLLTALLVWSGIFGLGAGSYFSGRSDPLKLLALFSTWGLALALLAVLVVRSLAAREWRRPHIAELLVLAGFGLMVGALRELPAPWTQIERIGRTSAHPLYGQAEIISFMSDRTTPGEHVGILVPMGQRIARTLRLVDTVPFSFVQAIATERQFRMTIAQVRREGATSIFMPEAEIAEEHRGALVREGFSMESEGQGVSEWVDTTAQGG
jgi:hypothetical protein